LDYTDPYEFDWAEEGVEEHQLEDGAEEYQTHVPRRVLSSEFGLISYKTAPIVVDHGQDLREYEISDGDHAMAYMSWATSTSDNTSTCWLQLIPTCSWSFGLYLLAKFGGPVSWLVIAAALCVNSPGTVRLMATIVDR